MNDIYESPRTNNNSLDIIPPAVPPDQPSRGIQPLQSEHGAAMVLPFPHVP